MYFFCIVENPIQMLRLFDLGAIREVPLSVLLLASEYEPLFVGAGLQDK